MSEAIKFIHSADIHLGKELSFENSKDDQLQQILKNATNIAFKNLVKLAVNEKVDFIIVAGDLYDREARSIKSSRFFLEQCRYLNEKGIEVYLISGNHDPAGVENEVFELPQNVHYFSSEKVEVKKHYKNRNLAARILGQSYRHKFESRTMYNFYTVPDRSVFNLALLHTGLNKNNKHYVPVNKSDLLSKEDIHYWALGHLHQYQQLNNQPAVCFAGTIQGHNINEEGDKGAVLVEVDANLNTAKKFIPLAPVIFKQLEINLENEEELENISQLQLLLEKRINQLLAEIKKDNSNRNYKIKAVITRLIIKGRTKLHKYVRANREELEETLLNEFRTQYLKGNPYFQLHSIYLRTAKSLTDLDKIIDNNPLYQNLDNLIDDFLSDEDLKEELLAEWGDIWSGNPEAEDRANYKFYADQDLQQEILEEAKKIIISELLEDGD
ncbi:MAG: exonuclease SbcCD subunit D [Halanaerobium sp.]